MTNAITNTATVQSRNIGIVAALRCVTAVGRDARARQLMRDDLPAQPARHDSAKRLWVHTPTLMSAAHLPALKPATPPAAAMPFTGSEPANASRMSAWSRSASADSYLPPAVWASLVVVRAVSA